MSKVQLSISVALFMILVATGSIFAEDSQIIEKQNVPASVFTAFNQAFPDAAVISIEKEVDKGKIFYDFEIKNGKTEKDIIYLDDGTFYSTEEEISEKNLPGAVVDGLKKAFPKCEIDEADKIVLEAGIEYEVVIAIVDGDTEIEYEILISSEGNIISSDQIQDEDDIGDHKNDSVGEDHDNDAEDAD